MFNLLKMEEERMKLLIGKMAWPIGFISGLSIFAFWMSIVGNPHVVETVLGLVILVVVTAFVGLKLRKLNTD